MNETSKDRTSKGLMQQAANIAPGIVEVEELLATAEQQGSVTVEKIAAALDTGKLPVKAETTWSVGDG